MFWRATAIENALNLDINDPTELNKRQSEVPDEKLKEDLLFIQKISLDNFCKNDQEEEKIPF